MKEKQVVLHNTGMNRDSSISKTGENSVFENRNIRILARDNDTMLSVTNERGTKEIPLPKIRGKVIGWNVLNNHIVLFSREDSAQKLSLLAMASGISVYADRLKINQDGGQNVSFRLIVYQPIDPQRIENINVYYMPAEDYKEGEPINELAGRILRQYVGSTDEAIFSKTVTFSGIDGELLNNGYVLIVTYAYRNNGYDHELDADTSGWDDPDNPGGGGGDGEDGDDDLKFPIINEDIEATWKTVNELDYTFSLQNVGEGAKTITNPKLELKVVTDTREDIHTYTLSEPSSVTLGPKQMQSWSGKITDITYETKNQYFVKWNESNKWIPVGYAEDFVPPEDETEKEVLVHINLSYGEIPVNVGAQFNGLVCIATYKKGNTQRDIQVNPTWSTSNPNVARISNDGIITGVREGSCEITATFEGKTAYCTVFVQKQVTHDLVFIQLEVSSSKIIVGESANISCRAFFSDDTTEDITDKTQFTVKNTSILSLNGTTITGNKVGASDIIASYSGQTSSVTITVRQQSSGNDNDEGDNFTGTDFIYRIDYTESGFVMVRGKYPSDNPDDYELNVPLFEGNLGFDLRCPIESIVSEESDNLKKIYWIDGKNVLRSVNINEACKIENGKKILPGDKDREYFNSNKSVDFSLNVSIEKDFSGNTRPNGIAQYVLTYYNRHAQESGIAWVSDLVYLSPKGTGGAADGTNSNRVLFTLSNMDTSFSHFRLYLVFRSSLDGEAVTYLVADRETSQQPVQIVDDGSHLAVEDTMRILYLGSQPVIAGTITHKDNTMFLGDLQSVGKNDYSELEAIIKRSMFKSEWESSAVDFVYSNDSAGGTSGIVELSDIPYIQNEGYYPYDNQLKSTSSVISSFKGGEKYRFALKFKLKNGVETEAFWIGDKENTLYPIIDKEANVIKRICVRCTLPSELVSYLKKSSSKFATAQLLIAEATYADRSVKAQGFVNPTMFNTWERYNKRTYAVPSWITRPRGGMIPFRHFASVEKSTSSLSEIQCNYWEGDAPMTPYFQYRDNDGELSYAEDFNMGTDFDYIMLVYDIGFLSSWGNYRYDAYVYVVKGKVLTSDPSAASSLKAFVFEDPGSLRSKLFSEFSGGTPGQLDVWKTYMDPNGKFFLEALAIYCSAKRYMNHGTARKLLYTRICESLVNQFDIPSEFIVDYATFADSEHSWCKQVFEEKSVGMSFNDCFPNTHYPTAIDALNNGGEGRWKDASDLVLTATFGNQLPAYKKKNIMFVDENVVSLYSPDITYGISSFDNADFKFRIVGAAKMTSVISDYLLDTENTPPANKVFDKENFSAAVENGANNLSGIVSWPILKDYALFLKESDNEKDIEKYVSSDYKQGNNIIRYWIYMWHHSGTISGYTPEEETDTIHTQPVLGKKTFANLRFSYSTIFFNNAKTFEADSIRIANELGASAYDMKIDSESELYVPRPQMLLNMPGSQKYPIIYSSVRPVNTISEDGIESESAYLYSDSPVMLEYTTDSHAAISLHTEYEKGVSLRQHILPKLFAWETVELPEPEDDLTSPVVPWFSSEKDVESYSVEQYDWTDFAKNDVRADSLTDMDSYVFIGEIYKDFSGETDTRYGGISANAIAANRFIVAGPAYSIADMVSDGNDCVYGNQGDTYIQRWDCLNTKPYSSGSENNVIDITSVMLETHVNIDGRTDLQRGINEIASIDIPQFGTLNRVYSQKNNFSVARDLNDEFNDDSYRSSLTWTLPKADGADIDEWMHITLASSLKLDSDKGICQALRRFQNSIISFQDKGIAEILFNSRTQLSTQDGVPVEIANSGKVDGKRYITGKYGCSNKWSITEGKAALYFVDNINKAFCSFNGTVEPLSEKLGFGVWFRNNNSMKRWNPVDFDNIVSYYDRIHSDVYLVTAGGKGSEYPTLVYNELLGRFTSFYDYSDITMLANVGERLVSVYDSRLWLQNEGAYCNFFGKTYPFSVQYRVTPEPYSDKIWTNVEYRADFYKILDSTFENIQIESELTEDNNLYLPNETFNYMRFWNEYQTTPREGSRDYKIIPEKRFRIWRVIIPRAIKTNTNKYGLDRIRNPWINILFKKTDNGNQNLMQLHDIIVKYFE